VLLPSLLPPLSLELVHQAPSVNEKLAQLVSEPPFSPISSTFFRTFPPPFLLQEIIRRRPLLRFLGSSFPYHSLTGLDLRRLSTFKQTFVALFSPHCAFPWQGPFLAAARDDFYIRNRSSPPVALPDFRFSPFMKFPLSLLASFLPVDRTCPMGGSDFIRRPFALPVTVSRRSLLRFRPFCQSLFSLPSLHHARG